MNNPFDNLLDRLARSTRSPRGRYSAENSWKILEERVFLKAHRRRRLYRWLGGAAAAVLLFVAGWTAYEALRPVPTQTFSTLAEVRSLTLPDGTEVTLNRYSSLTCPERFRRDRRDVSLQGEACFRVSKDARRPFTVEAGGMEVRVLGTHFNVEAYPADAEARTTLLEGSVAVSAGGGKERLVLRPNEAAVYNRRTGSLRQEATPAAGDEIAWSQGVFLFRRQTLQEIAQQLQNITQAIEDEANARENADAELGNSIPQITALTNDEIDQAIAEAEAEMQQASLQAMEAESGN